MSDLGDRSGYKRLAILLGWLVLAAALLKGHELVHGPVSLPSRWLPPFAILMLVVSEICFGLWLLSGLYAPVARRSAVGAFACFAAVNVAQLAAGSDSCGCFGPLTVHPAYTLGLDSIALAGLLAWHPRCIPAATIRSHPLRFAGVCGIAAAVAVGGAACLWIRETTGEEFVVVEPASWLGQRFPLLGDIDVREQLADGEWLVVLLRYDCEDCRRKLPGFESAARREGCRLALITVPPSPAEPARDGDWTRGRLDAGKTWVVRTPVAFRLSSGTVTAEITD